MIEKHFHWSFHASNADNTDPVTVKVQGYATEPEAMWAAKQMVVREHFVLESTWECATCGLEKRQLAIQQEVMKMMGVTLPPTDPTD